MGLRLGSRREVWRWSEVKRPKESLNSLLYAGKVVLLACNEEELRKLVEDTLMCV